MNNKKSKVKNFSYKAVAVILAWFFWWVPLGLHRLWMRQKYWWLHPIFFLSAAIASNAFFRSPENIDVVTRIYAATGYFPHLRDYSHLWLLCFTAGWIALIIYDALKVFSWPVPGAAKEEEASDA
ncbi:hypothetical protein [Sulfuricella sp.]|uniref:hypothetical protein n=1 Tax=Sulfuricella sp. TaxID=2099377 RepID=UPI002C9B012E|nr:hypothetical protein [Sulfuricella sp.]HUX62236.1 hypothetical protein [Sulfuricella sp.]